MASLIGFILAVLLGFVPMLLLAGIIYWLDRYEKEPRVLLGGVFSWGAIVAVIGALVLQIILGQSVLVLTGSHELESAAGAALFAPVTEEILKGLAVFLVFWLVSNEFDSILDGIVYASITALGFAATENTLYYFSAYLENGLGAMAALVFLRFVIFGWQHAFFTSFTGIGLAVARLNKNPMVKTASVLGGLSLAILAHALHNSLLTFFSASVGLPLAAIVAWTGWLLMFAFILGLIWREKTWLAQYLREEVDLNIITPTQYQSACSMFGQSRARMAALATGRLRATNRFYQLCGELSHKKRQLASFGEETGNTRWIETLRAEIHHMSSSI